MERLMETRTKLWIITSLVLIAMLIYMQFAPQEIPPRISKYGSLIQQRSNESNNVHIQDDVYVSLISHINSNHPNEVYVTIYGEVYNEDNNTIIRIDEFHKEQVQSSNSSTANHSTSIRVSDINSGYYLGSIHSHPTNSTGYTCALSKRDLETYNSNRHLNKEIMGVSCIINGEMYLVLFYPNDNNVMEMFVK